jgi:hypothetical protein
MKTKATYLRTLQNEQRQYEVTFAVEEKMAVEAIKKLAAAPVSIEVKKWREARSLDANAYFWKLVGEIAKHPSIRSTPDEIYILMLERYGVFEVVPVWKKAKNIVINAVRHCVEIGEKELGGQEFVFLRCYKGSSEYDTKEMSDLIDGVVGEAQALGIETLTPDELAKLQSLKDIMENKERKNGD